MGVLFGVFLLSFFFFLGGAGFLGCFFLGGALKCSRRSPTFNGTLGKFGKGEPPLLVTGFVRGFLLFFKLTIFGRILFQGASCSSVVRAFAYGAMGRRIGPTWGGPIELFLVPASAPRLV